MDVSAYKTVDVILRTFPACRSPCRFHPPACHTSCETCLSQGGNTGTAKINHSQQMASRLLSNFRRYHQSVGPGLIACYHFTAAATSTQTKYCRFPNPSLQ